MNRPTSTEERVAIVELAHRMGLSLSTVRKWRRGGGRAALVSTMGRPARGALSTYRSYMHLLFVVGDQVDHGFIVRFVLFKRFDCGGI